MLALKGYHPLRKRLLVLHLASSGVVFARLGLICGTSLRSCHLHHLLVETCAQASKPLEPSPQCALQLALALARLEPVDQLRVLRTLLLESLPQRSNLILSREIKVLEDDGNEQVEDDVVGEDKEDYKVHRAEQRVQDVLQAQRVRVRRHPEVHLRGPVVPRHNLEQRKDSVGDVLVILAAGKQELGPEQFHPEHRKRQDRDQGEYEEVEQAQPGPDDGEHQRPQPPNSPQQTQQAPKAKHLEH
mmetsp:Transcript_6417/g.14805  ORF Transcript_6417/g.14805 Transcript_6417/m.14805 type:complete len:244 (-) Transcript_6417:3121-3852(-)